ncbi:hypothetical protein A2Z67_01775 [Candidatus Woesebacteria bacterium RBG_13_36_22]|uniref:Uncharacterized protein n=1 Tax=Candidatus Woesebacteria bacterium RBG_13_36_22 TaxID=1802478 RepID=A0A1F7X0F9_9BACT|nr:MAG: hypothetical protein A2Z67_01775 [Candidatus Woesebacteria bacterium RBG_13_36_22]
MQINLGSISLKVYVSKTAKRIGVCSQKSDEPDNHCLLWDFDDARYVNILYTLYGLQEEYKLPRIYVIESSLNHYHAYCFASRSFREVLHILSDTPEICMTYLRIGATRGYFTLRISPRADAPKFELKTIIPSRIADEMLTDDVTVNEYITSNRGRKNA